MKLTVGMPVYNRAGVLRQTIEQVLNQTFTDFEFLIYNDGSIDDSAEIIRSYNDSRVKFFDKPNLGPPHPLNFIIKESKGEYLIILHDHDIFDPKLLEKSVNALDKHLDAAFVLQGSAWIDEDGVSNYKEMLLDIPEYNSGRIFGVNMLAQKKTTSSIFHACSMVRRSSLRQIGDQYNVEFGLYADTDVWLRLLYYYPFVYLNEVLFKFRTREKIGHFLTGQEFKIADWIYKIYEKNIDLYFSDLEERKKQLKYLEQKKLNKDIFLTLYYAANAENDLYRKGLERIHENKIVSIGFKGLASALSKSRGLSALLKGSLILAKKVKNTRF